MKCFSVTGRQLSFVDWQLLMIVNVNQCITMQYLFYKPAARCVITELFVLVVCRKKLRTLLKRCLIVHRYAVKCFIIAYV